jgi:hypothetical protein
LLLVKEGRSKRRRRRRRQEYNLVEFDCLGALLYI